MPPSCTPPGQWPRLSQRPRGRCAEHRATAVLSRLGCALGASRIAMEFFDSIQFLASGAFGGLVFGLQLSDKLRRVLLEPLALFIGERRTVR